MTLIEKITEYRKVVFPTNDAVHEASDTLMDFVVSDSATMMAMVGPNRVVMWGERGLAFERRVLYLSPGALTILERFVALPAAETISPTDLPAHRTMLLGDASDWELA